MTPKLNAVDAINTVDKYTAAQTAVQNDLVLETLFKYLNLIDLLSCRIVNKQWQYEATKELRRQKLVIKFCFSGRVSQSHKTVVQNVCRRLNECKTPSLLPSFQVKTVSTNGLRSVRVACFFTTVGSHLKNLTLLLNYSGKTSSSFKSSFLGTALQNLLFRQAPNLEFLEISFDFLLHWERGIQKLNVFGQNQNDHNDLQLLPNLKTFIVSGSPAPNFLADVINLAVNLRSFGGAWSTCIKYLMGAEGGAKIHQLKSLQLANHSRVLWNIDDFELMEAFLTKHKQNLKLETFECVNDLLQGGAYSTSRFFSVINPILECSSGSLQKLRIEPAKRLEDLLIIPRLPKLKEIGFDCVWGNLHMLRWDGFFPRGFNMNHSFPNVSTIVLLRCTAFLFREFANRIGIELTEPVPSVRYIILIYSRKKRNIAPPLVTVTDFRHVFPNLVSISCVNKDKYYDM